MEALPLADLLQALADPTRLRILALLRHMELSVGELISVRRIVDCVTGVPSVMARAGLSDSVGRPSLGPGLGPK